MPALTDIVAHANAMLRLTEIPDYGNALNGLQLENSNGEVTRIAAAVDATLPVMQKAVEAGADLLVVHHGMFWSGLQTITGPVFQKVTLAGRHQLAIYSAHLPLDVHPQLGNNALLARSLGLEPDGGFLDFKTIKVGVTTTGEVALDDLTTRLKGSLNGPVHVCAGGPTICRRIGISTGGSGSEVAAAKAAGLDTFITGEGPHWSYTLAEELGINVLYGGHYATETFGVKALAEHLAQQFGIDWSFIDHPTGM